MPYLLQEGLSGSCTGVEGVHAKALLGVTLVESKKYTFLYFVLDTVMRDTLYVVLYTL